MVNFSQNDKAYIPVCLFSPTPKHQPSEGKLPVMKVLSYDHWPIHHDISNPPQQRLTSRKPLWCAMTPTDIRSQWKESWKLAPVVNTHLVDDHTIRQRGFTLPISVPVKGTAGL